MSWTAILVHLNRPILMTERVNNEAFTKTVTQTLSPWRLICLYKSKTARPSVSKRQRVVEKKKRECINTKQMSIKAVLIIKWCRFFRTVYLTVSIIMNIFPVIANPAKRRTVIMPINHKICLYLHGKLCCENRLWCWPGSQTCFWNFD